MTRTAVAAGNEMPFIGRQGKPWNSGARPPVGARLEHLCEVMHDAYEKAAAGNGWETQAASRKPWTDVPEANKATMRAAVTALLKELES
ncbi:hypothetical protein [Kineosporia babensis]|uniref:Uncharacterized protein n=1 Tax=Kineosporia babensis TaxID=499548 RepID=A0A9X1N9E4_9ACTN|nr:hypothetical protein [Kineosporia babensis]MCD5310807.1 hypothetical protein [Kineosporia babensis]